MEDDLGATLEATFEWFDREPLAAASIAQVHAARLRTGEPVVVKVQRPSVATLVRKDLRVMAWLAPHLVGRIPVAALANPPALVELFAETITEELDFRLEAENMLDVARVLADLGQRGYVIPRPHPTLVTRRVLVMERLEGFAFDDVDAMKAAGIDTTAVVRTGMIAFMEGAMIHGVFHGDLHGGNLFVMPRRPHRPARLRHHRPPRRASAGWPSCGSCSAATTNDVKGQLAALRDLGALPPDTDLEAVIADLGLDRPAGRPDHPHRRRAGEGGAADRQGPARLRRPHAQGAHALREEHGVPRRRHRHAWRPTSTCSPRSPTSPCTSRRPTASGSAGTWASTTRQVEIDLDGVKASLGVDASTERLTYRDLQERRALINKRMQERGRAK